MAEGEVTVVFARDIEPVRVGEATLLTLEDLDLKNLHLRIHRLKHGVSSQKPLWRYTAELLGLLGLSRLKSLTPYIPSGCLSSLEVWDRDNRRGGPVWPPRGGGAHS